jgi:hypothetical protein
LRIKKNLKLIKGKDGISIALFMDAKSMNFDKKDIMPKK